MDDYIKREDALNTFSNAFYAGLAAKINAIPSEDVAPVRHGRWNDGKVTLYNWGGEEIGEKSTWKCSLCDEVGFWLYKYCPSCGAKMDLED